MISSTVGGSGGTAILCCVVGAPGDSPAEPPVTGVSAQSSKAEDCMMSSFGRWLNRHRLPRKQASDDVTTGPLGRLLVDQCVSAEATQRGKLGGFINAVKAQSDKTIGAAEATTLVTQATTLRKSLGCRAY
jgi:hypothetical protein